MRRSTALALAAGGVIAASRPAGAQKAPDVVRIGSLAIDSCGVPYYGAETGIFLHNGINAQVETLTNGAAIVAATVGGDLDVGMANTTSIAVAIARGLPLQAIAPGVLYSKKDADPNFVVAKDSPIKSPKDLVDGTIALSSLGDLYQLGVLAWFQANNVPSDRLKFVELKLGEMGPAVQRGTVQAAFMSEPYKLAAVQAGQVRNLTDPFIAIAPEISTVVWFSSKSWLQKNQDAAKRLVSAIYATGKWANSHPVESGTILAKAANMDPTVVHGMQRRIYPTQNDRKYVDAILALAARYGVLPRAVPFEEFSAFPG